MYILNIFFGGVKTQKIYFPDDLSQVLLHFCPFLKKVIPGSCTWKLKNIQGITLFLQNTEHCII